ncbi:neuronal membrane glycoprotein M6-a-like isoform X2 [Haliotis cracherodii]|uniref:neuronal membrane glycoprotein M6-a-like isoform X2 n=1 Tax=Haliotis cracherodii TaxID=6455 RepID=UPI0039E7E155
MAQVQRLASATMDNQAPENGELLSLNDYDHDDVKISKRTVRGDTCCDKFLRCLSHVPCASLIAWIILFMGLGGVTGSLLIGTYKTRALLEYPDVPRFHKYDVVSTNGNGTMELEERTEVGGQMLWFVELMLIGVVVSMFVLGTLFLLCGHLSTDPTSRRVFNSSAKNRCARGLNIFLLMFVYFLTLVWVLALALLTVPLVLLGMLFILTGHTGLTCIDLKNYGFSERNMCGEELNVFTTKAKDVLICYSACYFSALLVVVSLIHFLISISANITHLKDNRFVTLNAYETEEHSKHSVLDTNM